MASAVPIPVRNAAIALFRERILDQIGATPFPHQREVWLASEGKILLPVPDSSGVTVNVSKTAAEPIIERWMVAPRPEGPARFLSDLGAFKIGKSWGAGMFAAAFAIVPGAKVSLIGLEYDICEPEFSYIEEFLLSERGMGLPFETSINRPKDGKMYMKLKNGCVFEARSWERKDSLKGKEIDAYIYCEAYQLPGIECFTAFSQNLRARAGFAYFATTPDRPWINELHKLGGNHVSETADPEWHCVCSVPSDVNAYTFDAKAKARDARLMTREKFQIHYEGKLGDYVGRVFNYQQGQRQFNATTHPALFEGGTGRDHLVIPNGWSLVNGADTGTFYTGLIVAFDPEGAAFVLDEIPNYAYVAGEAERDEEITIPAWANRVHATCARWAAPPVFRADGNSQFKAELRNYGITLLGSNLMRETRTEITREFFQHGAIWFAPWLRVLPFEIENAAWPDDVSASGRYERVKDRDHTLDCLEHVLSARPRGRYIIPDRTPRTWAQTFGKGRRPHTNPHLGVN